MDHSYPMLEGKFLLDLTKDISTPFAEELATQLDVGNDIIIQHKDKYQNSLLAKKLIEAWLGNIQDNNEQCCVKLAAALYSCKRPDLAAIVNPHKTEYKEQAVCFQSSLVRETIIDHNVPTGAVRDQAPQSNGNLSITQQKQNVKKLCPCLRRHKRWLSCYAILIVCCCASFVPSCSYLFISVPDYTQVVHSGDTVLVPIPLQFRVQSVAVSLSPQCEGALYLVPDSEVITRTRYESSSLGTDYLYLVSNTVIHFFKNTTAGPIVVWIVDSLQVAYNIGLNQTFYNCLSPPQGATCLNFTESDNATVWNFIIKHTSYYWIRKGAKYDPRYVSWNYTLNYYNQSDYDVFLVDSSFNSKTLSFAPPLFQEQKKMDIVFSATQDSCTEMKLSLVSSRVDVCVGPPLLLFPTLFILVIFCHCVRALHKSISQQQAIDSKHC